MMLFLFSLILLAAIFAWKGWRHGALICLTVLLVLASISFYNDITAHLDISL